MNTKEKNSIIDIVLKLYTVGLSVVTFLTVALYAYSSYYARPTGDDLNFSFRTHRAWVNTHSILEVLKASWEEILHQRATWAADYTMVFFVSLTPEIFKEWTFWISICFILVVLVISVLCVTSEIGKRHLGLNGWQCAAISCTFIFLYLQHMPSTYSGMYWFTGSIHYVFPFSLTLWFVALLFRYSRHIEESKGCTGDILGMCLIAVIVGGAGFFGILFLVLLILSVILFEFLVKVLRKKNEETLPKSLFKKFSQSLWLLIPMGILLVSLVILITAPGQRSTRAGGALTFSLSLGFKAIFESIRRSGELAFRWITTKVFVLPCLIGLALVSYHFHKKTDNYRLPLIFVIYMYLMYAAMYSPWVYSEFFDTIEASVGPENYCFLTFLLVMTVSVVYCTGWFKNRIEISHNHNSKRQIIILAGCVIVILACVAVNRHDIKNTHGYVGTEYLVSGQAADYRKQCEYNMELLLNDSIKEVEMIPTNNMQGLLNNMVPVPDTTSFTNWVYAMYYDKDVISVKQDTFD